MASPDPDTGNFPPQEYHSPPPSERGEHVFWQNNRPKIFIATGTAVALIIGAIIALRPPMANSSALPQTVPSAVVPALGGVGSIENQNPSIPNTIADATPSPTPMPYARTIIVSQPKDLQTTPPAAQAAATIHQGQDEAGTMTIDQPTQNEQAEEDLRHHAAVSARPQPLASETNEHGGVRSSNAIDATDVSSLPAQEHLRYVEAHDHDDVGYIPPRSIYQLDPATIIPARLVTKIISDLPGPVIAEVTVPIYDSRTHTTMVIPPGTRLFGSYDNDIAHGQNRLLVRFQRLIFPNGREFSIGGEGASDAQGTAGLSGDVDAHRGSLYTTATLLTVLAGTQAALSPNGSSVLSQPSVGAQMQSAAGAQLDQVSSRILNQHIQQAPTLIIRPPCLFQVIVTRDLPLEPYQEIAQ